MGQPQNTEKQILIMDIDRMAADAFWCPTTVQVKINFTGIKNSSHSASMATKKWVKG